MNINNINSSSISSIQAAIEGDSNDPSALLSAIQNTLAQLTKDLNANPPNYMQIGADMSSLQSLYSTLQSQTGSSNPATQQAVQILGTTLEQLYADIAKGSSGFSSALADIQSSLAVTGFLLNPGDPAAVCKYMYLELQNLANVLNQPNPDYEGTIVPLVNALNSQLELLAEDILANPSKCPPSSYSDLKAFGEDIALAIIGLESGQMSFPQVAQAISGVLLPALAQVIHDFGGSA